MNSKLFNKAHKDFKVTSPFGLRNPFPGVLADHEGKNYHIGADYAYPQRTDLVSPVDVEILKTMDWGAYGGQIFAYNKFFDVTLHFAHINSILVKQGQIIKAGTVLGLSGGSKGTTGAGTSTGAHLHIGLAKGRRIDLSKGVYGDGTWIDIDTFDFTIRKSNGAVAKEVLNGDWGNGQERKNRLTKAGYDYAAVQAIVNAQSKSKRKSNEEIAREVVLGKWGNGQARKNALIKEGCDYKAVQAIVNKMV